MTTNAFDNLDEIFLMFSPSDLVGTLSPGLGDPSQLKSNVFVQLRDLFENGGRGVRTISDIVNQIETLSGQATSQDRIQTWGASSPVNVSQYLTIWSSFAPPKDNPSGVSSLLEIIGNDFKAPNPSSQIQSVILSRTPFLSPATRNTSRSDIFMNSMPSVVLSQMTPYLQVDFQFARPASNFLQTVSQLKLLMGAADTSAMSGDSANAQMVAGHRIVSNLPTTDLATAIKQSVNPTSEVDYAGMELFTSPVTLTNPQPNVNVGNAGLRYTNVLDPFRPFASLEHVTISAKPSGAGFYCYKTANMTIKVHDRSRLNEISDLIRPLAYNNVTVWMTYGWRAPVRGNQTQNPYFAYINDNLMMREAYHVKNSSFTFDKIGQVTLNLELYTKGVTELRDIKITEFSGTAAATLKKIKELTEKISAAMIALNISQPQGLNKEIRAYQLLEDGAQGVFPSDLTTTDVKTSIDKLDAALSKGNTDLAAQKTLIGSMKDLYKSKNSKFDLKEQLAHDISTNVASMFEKVADSKSDPFLVKKSGDLLTAISTFTKSNPNQVVSFGRLFCTFALRHIVSMPEVVDEIQVYFYSLNEHCGPVSCYNIAEFPINLKRFKNAYEAEMKSRPGETITLEDFMALAVNSQFLDISAIGYGLNEFFQPDTGEQLKKDAEGAYESFLVSQSKKYGTFQIPSVEMHIEMSHKRTDATGQCDVLQEMLYSPLTGAQGSKQMSANSAYKIMRIHFYDRQANAYESAFQLLSNVNNAGSSLSNPAITAGSSTPTGTPPPNAPSRGVAGTLTSISNSTGIKVTQDKTNGKIILQYVPPVVPSSNQQIKDIVSKLVPTIRFGSNGTTITNANVTSKAEPLLSTVNMQRTMKIKNNVAPNGGGEHGLPLRVIPAQMTLTTLGNPLATMAQQYFVDFQTGTTLDNLYIVTGLDHSFSPGKFETSWKLAFADAYGRFESSTNLLDQAKQLPDPAPAKKP